MGVYHHWDGYPTALGAELFKLVNGKFKGNVGKMLNWAIDSHSAGWSTIMGSSETHKPECFCHPKRKRRAEALGNWFTHANTEGDIEWLYIFDEQKRIMHVIDNRTKATTIVKFDAPEPNWEMVQCGEHLENCTHYAWVHFPELKGTPMENLSTATYLGRRPMQFHDAIAVIVKGKRYKLTGSGHNARFGRESHLPENCWVSSVVARNGRRMDIPTALVNNGVYTPYPGVTLVFPPTKVNTDETIGYPVITIKVSSHSKPGVEYTLTIEGGKRTCSCPDFKYRGGNCKHLY